MICSPVSVVPFASKARYLVQWRFRQLEPGKCACRRFMSVRLAPIPVPSFMLTMVSISGGALALGDSGILAEQQARMHSDGQA
jgi:hypothetical protein